MQKMFCSHRLISEGWFDNEKDSLAWVMKRSVPINEEPILSLKVKAPIDGVIRLKQFKRIYLNKGIGASLVYAVDTGYGELAGTLANHPSVSNMEKSLHCRCV